MDIFSRLYEYRQTPSLSPLENYLTEGFADIFNRLPRSLRAELLAWMLPPRWSDQVHSECAGSKRIEAMTQVPIKTGELIKRPDIIIHLDRGPFILVEAKVDAPFTDNQLETYREWIGTQRASGWPGAVVLLTHRTQPPEWFGHEQNGTAVICTTRKWGGIGRWLAKNVDGNQSDKTHCALASDFTRFLEGRHMMTEYVTSRDLAATELFLPSLAALSNTFRTAMEAVDLKFRKLRGGNFHYDFWPHWNMYCGWYYLNSSLNPPGTKFWMGIGICFWHDGVLGFPDPGGVPKHEPFFNVFIADDIRPPKNASEFVSKNPEGWELTCDNKLLIAARPVGQFEADPDARMQALVDWSQEQVGRFVTCIPNFDIKPVENVSEAPVS